MLGKLSTAHSGLLYDFCPERHVPQDQVLRQIDGVLDLGGLRDRLEPYDRATGRPSVAPKPMIRMLIVGYCYGQPPPLEKANRAPYLIVRTGHFCYLGVSRELQGRRAGS